VRAVEPTAAELRVLGCLIEKQRATPESYPLSVNALRLACNQATNRDPVVDYDEDTVREALGRLRQRRWARLASGSGSRAPKYRHLLEEALSLDAVETSLLAVLMLRGPQTPGELKQRTERLHRFGGLEEVEATLERLAQRELLRRIERRPGQKEVRYVQLLGGGSEPSGRAGDVAVTALADEAPAGSEPLAARLERLEGEVESLRGELSALVRRVES